MLALRKAGHHTADTLPAGTATTAQQATDALDRQLMQVLEAMGTAPRTLPSTDTQDLLLALWVQAAK